MGRFDHLVVRDSDSDSSAAPTPANQEENSPKRTENDPQLLSETMPAPESLLTEIPSAFQRQGTGDVPQSATAPPASQTDSVRESEHAAPSSHHSVADSAALVTCRSSPGVSGVGAVATRRTPATPSLAASAEVTRADSPVQAQAVAGSGAVAPTAGSLAGAESVRSVATATGSTRGLPARRAAPPPVLALRTPVDGPEPAFQPLSIAKDSPPATTIPTARKAPFTADGPVAEGSHHRAILSRTPTGSSSSSGVATSGAAASHRSSHRATPRSATRPADASAPASEASRASAKPTPQEADEVKRESQHNSERHSTPAASSAKGASVKEESINANANDVAPPAEPHTHLHEPEAADEERRNGAGSKSASQHSEVYSSTSQQELSGSRSHSDASAPRTAPNAEGPASSSTHSEVIAAAGAAPVDGGNTGTEELRAQDAASLAAGGSTASAPKQKKAKAGCGLFSFCRKKKTPSEAAPSVVENQPSSHAIAAAASANPSERVSQQQVYPVEAADIPLSASELGSRASVPAAVAATPNEASVRSVTPKSPQDSPTGAAVAPTGGSEAHTPVAVPLDNASAHVAEHTAMESIPVDLAAAPAVEAPTTDGVEPTAAEEAPKRKRRIRVRKQRGSKASSQPDREADEEASASRSSPDEASSGEKASKRSSAAASAKHSQQSAPVSTRSAEQAAQTLLPERARTPTPNDVAFPVPPSSDQGGGRPSTAVVRSVHSASASEAASSAYKTASDRHVHEASQHSDAESSSYSYSSSYSRRNSQESGSSVKGGALQDGTEFPDTTEGAGLTTEAHDALTRGQEPPSPDEFSDASLPASQDGPYLQTPQRHGDEDELSRLPPYQRRLVLDMQAKERRELEELAKEWKELTFRPAINPNPRYAVKNKMHFSDRLSVSPRASPAARSLGSGEGRSGGTSPRRAGNRHARGGDATPSSAPDASQHAPSRPRSPQSVFDRLTAKPKEQRRRTLPTEEQGCSFAPAISEKSRQMAPTTNVFARLTRQQNRGPESGSEGHSGEEAGPTPGTSPRRRGTTGSTSPSPRRSSAARSDRADGRRESVFERLYRLRKTPNTTPQVSPQRLEHVAEDSQEGDEPRRVLEGPSSDEGRTDSLGEEVTSAIDNKARAHHTPFYPSTSGSLEQSTKSADLCKPSKDPLPETSASKMEEQDPDNAFRSGYYGSASGSESVHSSANRTKETPIVA